MKLTGILVTICIILSCTTVYYGILEHNPLTAIVTENEQKIIVYENTIAELTSQLRIVNITITQLVKDKNTLEKKIESITRYKNFAGTGTYLKKMGYDKVIVIQRADSWADAITEQLKKETTVIMIYRYSIGTESFRWLSPPTIDSTTCVLVISYSEAAIIVGQMPHLGIPWYAPGDSEWAMLLVEAD